MPRIKSAQKRVEVAERNRQRNVAVRSAVRTAIKKVLENANGENAQTALSQAFSEIDRAVRKGVLKKNTAARYKSRVARHAAKTA